MRALAQLHPLLQRIYAARGVHDHQALDLSLSSLQSFEQLKGIKPAVDLLYQALKAQRRILIIGDFDADGATSSALAVKTLRALGAHAVDYLVPNRFEYGYGLTPEIVAVAKTRNPDLIITVDNGISSVEGVAAAQRMGMQVIITDHHLPGAEIPLADAIVNPNQLGCPFPAKNTAGVGVIFYLLLALRSHLRTQNWFAENSIVEPNMADYLDLVALGSVADVVPLDLNNRILVHQGIARIRSGKSSAGLRALCFAAGRDPARISAADMGFALGPRLNAAGRLEDMSLGIACLLCEEEQEALALAQQLDQLNAQRKEIEAQMKDEALASLAKLTLREDQVGICLYDASWHPGVIGILASRIKDRYHRPTVVFAAGDGNEIKGSARSIEGFHIRDALDQLAKTHPDLLNKFGGHAMAAGLSIDARDFDRFAAAFAALACEQLPVEAREQILYHDGVLEPQWLNLECASLLRDAGPWGQHFPAPLFAGEFRVLEQRLVGERHLRLRLSVAGSDADLSAIAFFVDLALWPNQTQQVRLLYRLDINYYRGEEKLQLLVEHIEVC